MNANFRSTGMYGWAHYGFTWLGFLHSLHCSKQSTPDAPLFFRLSFDLGMLLPADIVMDIAISFVFSSSVLASAQRPEVGGLLTQAAMLYALLMLLCVISAGSPSGAPQLCVCVCVCALSGMH